MSLESLAEAAVELAAKLALGNPKLLESPNASAKATILEISPRVPFDELERGIVTRLGSLAESAVSPAVDLAEQALRSGTLSPDLVVQDISVDGLFGVLVRQPLGDSKAPAAYQSLLRACCWEVLDANRVLWNQLRPTTGSWQPRWRQIYSGGPIRSLDSIQLETGPYIVAGGENGTVMLDQFTGTSAQVDRHDTHSATVVAAGFAPGPTAVCASAAGDVRLTAIPTPSASVDPSAALAAGGEVRAVTATRRGSVGIICAAWAGGINVWLNRKLAVTLPPPKYRATALTVLQEEGRPVLIIGGADMMVRSHVLPLDEARPWKIPFADEVLVLESLTIGEIAHVIAGGGQGKLVLYDMSTHEATELIGHSKAVRDIAVIEDSERPIAITVGGSIRVWDLTMGEQISTTLGSAHAVTTVRLADRHYLLAGMDDGIYVTELTALIQQPEPWEHAGFSTDTATGEDRLGISSDVETLAALMLAKDVDPPLAVGLFGDWGTGKSFFMRTLNNRIAQLANDARAAGESSFCGNVCQVEFNAWHYADANLWASLAGAIFDDLATDTTTPTLNELPSVSDVRDQLKQQQSKAEQKLRQATEDLAALNKQLNAKEIEQALRQAGIPEATAAKLGAKDAVTELASLPGRIRFLLRHSKWSVRVALLAGIALLASGPVLLAAAPVEWRIASIVSAIGVLAVTANPYLKRASTALRVAEDVVRQADETRREPLRQLILKYEDEHRALTAQLDELNQAHSVRSFAAQRLATADYRKHEGVVSLIRRDLKELSRRLMMRADIERIVLYIDDLDRCPPKRVVEVLQAVHLLLAFPLFVVVVGVDSRWLLGALHDQYAELMESEETPQNYLEKIFQISLCLRPMTRQGYADLITADLLPNLTDPEPTATAEPIETQPAQQIRQRPAEPAEAPRQPPVQPASAERREQATRRQQVVAQALRLNRDERLLIVDAHPLIGTPRTAKRLVNVYRLLRAGLSPQERERLLAGDFRPVIVLLAILVGFPLQGADLLDTLANKPGNQNFFDLLDSFPAEGLAAAVRRVSAATDIPEETAAYARWAPRVARYSFRTGHVVRRPL